MEGEGMTWCTNCGKEFHDEESHIGCCQLGYGIVEGKLNEICPKCSEAVRTALMKARWLS